MHKSTYFDRIVGSKPIFDLSYHKGFSIYRESIYQNKSGSQQLFEQIVDRYESDNPGWNRIKTIQVDRSRMNLAEVRALPFREYNEKDIEKQVSFISKDFREGTVISNGGKFILIRVYALK